MPSSRTTTSGGFAIVALCGAASACGVSPGLHDGSSDAGCIDSCAARGETGSRSDAAIDAVSDDHAADVPQPDDGSTATPDAPHSPPPARLFAATSLWNTVKTPSLFAPAADSLLHGATYGLNDGAFDHPTYFAAPTDPTTTFTLGAGWGYPATTMMVSAPMGMHAASGSDGALTILLDDGRLLDMYGAHVAATSVTARYYELSDGINGTGFGDPTTGHAVGTTAIGSPQGAGTILARDVSAGTIPHALDMAWDSSALGGAGGDGGAQVLPAVASDDRGGTGPLPEGGLLLIPAGTPRPASLSPMGSALWDAAATYGVFITDQLHGNPMFYGDGTVASAFAASDFTTVGRALRLVVTW